MRTDLALTISRGIEDLGLTGSLTHHVHQDWSMGNVWKGLELHELGVRFLSPRIHLDTGLSSNTEELHLLMLH